MGPYLSPSDPTFDRLDAVVRAACHGLLSAAAAVVAGTVLGWTGSPLGWLLLLAAVPFVLAPLVRHRRTTAGRSALPVGHLDQGWRDLLATAAAATARIDAAHRDAPPGAVADHLALVLDTARHHVRRLHESATVAASLGEEAGRALLRDEAPTVERLVELADAAERLRAAQREQAGTDPLGPLIEATDRLAETLTTDVEDRPRRQP